MEAINSPKIAENLETEKSVVDTYRGPEGQVLMILVGLIGSGKSTFSKALETEFPSFQRCNQDELKDRRRVERLVTKSLSEGRSAVVDRTNVDARQVPPGHGQRKTWIDIARRFSHVAVWVVTMDTPYEVCAERLRTRVGHPTIKTWSVAKSVLDRFNAEFENPSALEDFDRMYELAPHATGAWTRQDIAKVLLDIEASPSTRLASQNSSLGADLALYVGIPLAVAVGAVGAVHHLLSKPSSSG